MAPPPKQVAHAVPRRVGTLVAHLTAASSSSSSSSSSSKVFTPESLRRFNGEGGAPVYLAIKGKVLDVTQGKSFYGPGGGYFALAGRDASRALARMDLGPANLDSPVRLDDLSDKERQTLDQWHDKLSAKYPQVGVFRDSE